MEKSPYSQDLSRDAGTENQKKGLEVPVCAEILHQDGDIEQGTNLGPRELLVDPSRESKH